MIKTAKMSVSGEDSGVRTFAMQIGLVRESVSVEGGELSMKTLTEIACAFVDRKVSVTHFCLCTCLGCGLALPLRPLSNVIEGFTSADMEMKLRKII